MRRNAILVFAVVVIGAAFVLPRLRGTAPTPGVFDAGLSLQDARSQSEQSGKPVLAYLTADWCGPCQTFKRTALSDPGVEAYIREHFVPVYIDIDKAPDDARSFDDVSSIPTTIVWKNGRELDRAVGVMDTRSFRSWLADATARDASAAAVP